MTMIRAFFPSCIAGILLTLATPVRAEITPVILRLNETAPSYAVPTNKVLLIEHGYTGEASGAANIVLLIQNGTNLNTGVRLDASWYRQVKTLNPSMKIPSGWTMIATNFGNIDGEGAPDPSIDNAVTLMGLLVDQQDLYAGIPHEIDQFRAAGGTGLVRIDIASPRPRIIRVEKSSDLSTWTPLPEYAFVAPFGRQEQGLSVPADASHEFIRTRVRSK